jgi:hypothetical protein
MKKLRRQALGFAAMAICAGSWGVAVAQPTCVPTAVTPLGGGDYNFQMNVYNAPASKDNTSPTSKDNTSQASKEDSSPTGKDSGSQPECANVSDAGFTITSAKFDLPTKGAPASYTSIYRGCHWGRCTSASPFPIQESNIASATTSVNLSQPSGYANNAAYDIWFNQISAASGQPNGTEVMIWLNHQGAIQPFGSRMTATATIDGVNYEVWTGNQSSWKVISYVASTPVAGVSSLNLVPFFADAVSRGNLDPSWWLIDVEFGFEIWTGGQGLAMSNFSVSAAARATTADTKSSTPSR